MFLAARPLAFALVVFLHPSIQKSDVPSWPVAALPDGPPAGAPQTAHSNEQIADDIVNSYFYFWSTLGEDVVSMNQFYAETVNFYGSLLNRSRLMDEKQRFAKRWPIRRFNVRPGSMSTACDETGCTVTCIVEWDASSTERTAHSSGTSSFTLGVVSAPGTATGALIVSETGSVLSAQRDAPAAPTASAVAPPTEGGVDPAAPAPSAATGGIEQGAAEAALPAYAEGRDTRIAYEAWFNAVPEGAYRQGIVFWAENRSRKPPPSCNQPGADGDWRHGCMDAQVRLRGSDLRRQSDRVFRLGWNSL